MKKLTFATINSHGRTMKLADILSVFPENSNTWHILYFYGIGIPPGEFSMEQFEDFCKSQAKGYRMSWEEVLEFSSGLHQTIDCLIVAVKPGCDFDRELIMNDSASLDALIECFDSTKWTVSLDVVFHSIIFPMEKLVKTLKNNQEDTRKGFRGVAKFFDPDGDNAG
jgi:hypothetical protein